MNKFKNWDEVLAWVIARQKERQAAHEKYALLTLKLLNQATLEAKARMTPEAIAAEEARREQINAAEEARLKAQGDSP